MRMFMTRRLEPLGCRVSTVDNASEAFAFLEKEKPDLILSDAVMPGMDGFALCRSIRDNSQLREIRFALLTSLAKDIHARSMEAGADDCIQKGEKDVGFRIRVRLLLQGSIQASSSTLMVAAASSATRSILQTHLSPLGITVQPVSELAEIVATAEKGLAGALILDTDLGKDVVTEWVKRLREEPGRVCIPILVSIAKGEEEFLEALEDRIQDFLVKPLSVEEDRHRIKMLLRYGRG